MPHFSYSLILEDKSFEKLGPCWSPRYIKSALQQKAMYCFKLIFPLFLGRKVQHLKLKHTSAVPLRLLGPAATTQAFHLGFKVWWRELGGGEWGRKGGQVECKKSNKQTKKKNGMGWVEGEDSNLSMITSPQPGWTSRGKTLTGFPCCVFFFCRSCHFPCWEDSCHPSHILSTEKAALPWAW